MSENRRRSDRWKQAGVVFSGLALLATVGATVFHAGVWVIDHRISDQLAPLQADLTLIKVRLGIPESIIAGRHQ